MSEINTSAGVPITSTLLHNYFRNLVNQFFKILPMRENEEDSLRVYMRSLQSELIGCREFVPQVGESSLYLTLLSILQYLIDSPECSVADVKREVFRAISICNKICLIYANSEVSK